MTAPEQHPHSTGFTVATFLTYPLSRPWRSRRAAKLIARLTAEGAATTAAPAELLAAMSDPCPAFKTDARPWRRLLGMCWIADPLLYPILHAARLDSYRLCWRELRLRLLNPRMGMEPGELGARVAPLLRLVGELERADIDATSSASGSTTALSTNEAPITPRLRKAARGEDGLTSPLRIALEAWKAAA